VVSVPSFTILQIKPYASETDSYQSGALLRPAFIFSTIPQKVDKVIQLQYLKNRHESRYFLAVVVEMLEPEAVATAVLRQLFP